MKIKNLKKILWVLAALVFSAGVSAQESGRSEPTETQSVSNEQCGTDILHKRMLKDPNFFRTFNKIHNSNQIRSSVNYEKTIPVIVHVIHSGQEYGEFPHITELEVSEIIYDVNQKFEGSNGNIEFCIASQDMSGNAINGIQYHDVNEIYPNWETASILNYYGSIINSVSYSSSEYLNLYIHEWSSGPLGFSWLPPTNYGAWVKTSQFVNVESDTFVHELGHYCGLAHTFSSNLLGSNYSSCSSAAGESNCETQGDRVCDTPPTPINWSCTPTCPELNPDMDNYMDYTPDQCVDSFTPGQVDRMHAQLEAFRYFVLNNPACEIPCQEYECPWDLNDDGVVAVQDLIEFLQNTGTFGECIRSDFNEDGIVGAMDLTELLQHFGYICGIGFPENNPTFINSVMEIDKYYLKNTYFFDITGRKIEDSRELLPGIYLMVNEWQGGIQTTQKVFLN